MNDAHKRVAVGALIFNDCNEILIVKPHYKDGWQVVGGMVESSENPSSAMRREIKEEVGLDLEVGRLLCVDYGPKDSDSIHLTFDCGRVGDSAQISYPDNEIVEHRFVSEKETSSLLRPKGAFRMRRVLEAFRTGSVAYIDDDAGSNQGKSSLTKGYPFSLKNGILRP